MNFTMPVTDKVINCLFLGKGVRDVFWFIFEETEENRAQVCWKALLLG